MQERVKELKSPADPVALLELSAVDAVAAMSRGEMSAECYAGVLLERCEAGVSLNAFISLEPATVLEAARSADQRRRSGAKLGPLFGLPIPIKDSVNTLDYATSAGTNALREFRPAADAPLVKQLRSSGALVLGKTNLHELSFGWTSNNRAFGAVRNPYDPDRIAGGSSGGTAVAIAARMAPLGLAEDTRGSIRVPAALCGISGFRPTTGRYASQGAVPISAQFDQLGPHARQVRDLALFDSVAADDWRALTPPQLSGVRLGVVRDYFYSQLDPEVRRVTESTLERLREAGAQVVETELPDLQTLIDLTSFQVVIHDAYAALSRYLGDFAAGLSLDEVLAQASSDIQEIFRTYVRPGAPQAVSEPDYARIQGQYLPALRRAYRDYFAVSGVSAMVYPVTQMPATLIGEETTVRIGAEQVPFSTAIGRNISPCSTAGIPGLVLPAGLAATGLPIGIEFDAPAGADRELLALGVSLEAALGTVPAPTLFCALAARQAQAASPVAR